MKILVDMNLSPAWVDALRDGGIEAIHWASVGCADAPDRKLMSWAEKRDYVVLTHDLDFSAILASSGARGPSVVQLRADDVLLQVHCASLIDVLVQFESELKEGAILSVDVENARVRLLPLGL